MTKKSILLESPQAEAGNKAKNSCFLFYEIIDQWLILLIYPILILCSKAPTKFAVLTRAAGLITAQEWLGIAEWLILLA